MIRDVDRPPDWPRFDWNRETLAVPLAEIRHRQGRLQGRMEGLGFDLQKEAEIETPTLDLLKSSEIEGEHLNPDQARARSPMMLIIASVAVRFVVAMCVKKLVLP